jgi:predicted NUDIX family NTP pyrophosphohydrolase
MAASSAGVLLYRWRDELEILLVHPGGPYWRGRDAPFGHSGLVAFG